MASQMKFSSLSMKLFPVTWMLVVMVILPSSLACMCSTTHPQEQFCNADFVLSGHVLQKSAVDNTGLRGRFGQFQYTINAERIYKYNSKLQEDVIMPAPITILTSPADSLCGPKNLKTDTKYLISGSIVKGELHIQACDWVEVWRDVTHQQKQGIKNFYVRYCNQCMIQSTMRSWQPNNPSSATGGCIYDPLPALQHGVEDCQALFATCVVVQEEVPNVGRACQWHHRRDDYQRSVERNRPYYQGVDTARSVDFPILGEVLT